MLKANSTSGMEDAFTLTLSLLLEQTYKMTKRSRPAPRNIQPCTVKLILK